MSIMSHVMAEDPAEDLAIAQAMATELEMYIIKEDLYRTLIVHTPGGDQKLMMTGGDLLSRMHRLRGERELLSREQQEILDAVEKEVSKTIRSLRTRFHQRLQREIKARLDSLRWFLDECREDIQRCRTNFPFEIRNRQRIEEILKELGGEAPAELREYLNVIDHRIRQLTYGGDFIWEPRLKGVFPAYPYWYLYVTP